MNISPFSSEGGDKKTKEYFKLMDDSVDLISILSKASQHIG